MPGIASGNFLTWDGTNWVSKTTTYTAALFSPLGTYHGRNGTSTFVLSNLQSRVPVDHGQGNGLSLVNMGDIGGAENVTTRRARCRCIPAWSPPRRYYASGMIAANIALVGALWGSRPVVVAIVVDAFDLRSPPASGFWVDTAQARR